MIALLLAWTLLLFVAYSFGSLAQKLSSYICKQNSYTWNLVDLFLLGLCLVSGLTNILHLFMPADTNMMFILLILGVLYWFSRGRALLDDGQRAFDYLVSIPKKYLFLLVTLIILVALFCCLYPRMTDTLYYHYQNLMWNNSYPTVPGLANLQPRFGFNSNLYLLTSTFGCYSLYNQFIFSVHTLLLAMMTVWIVGKVIVDKLTLRKVLALLMFICFVVIYKIHITSITSDFFSNLIVLYLFLNIILDENIIKQKALLYSVLPIFVITLKLSCAPIVLLSVYILFQNRKNDFIRLFACLVIWGLWIMIPWCYSTYILSGYLFFPLPYFDFFHPDWKVPMHYLVEQKEFIQAFAKYPNNLDIDSILQMSITEWFPIWWKSDMFYYNPIANRFFFFAIIICIPLGATRCFKYRRKHTTIVITWLISLIAIVIWFFNAPDFRFVYAFILNLVFTTFLGLSYSVKSKINIKWRSKILIYTSYLLIVFFVIFCGRWIYYQRGDGITFRDLVEKPTPISYIRHLKYADEFVTDEQQGFAIYRGSFSDEQLLSFDYPLPSSADFVGGIEMRGSNLEDGFRCKSDAPLRRTY